MLLLLVTAVELSRGKDYTLVITVFFYPIILLEDTVVERPEPLSGIIYTHAGVVWMACASLIVVLVSVVCCEMHCNYLQALSSFHMR